MKKKMIAIVFVAAFALTATAVFAAMYPNNNNTCCYPVRQACCPELNVKTTNVTGIKNYVDSKANTGMNSIFKNGGWLANAVISTGSATSVAGTENKVTSNVEVAKPVAGEVNVTTTNIANLMNTVKSKANSGLNTITNNCGKAEIQTGDATSAGTSTNVVESNVTVK